MNVALESALSGRASILSRSSIEISMQRSKGVSGISSKTGFPR